MQQQTMCAIYLMLSIKWFELMLDTEFSSEQLVKC